MLPICVVVVWTPSIHSFSSCCSRKGLFRSSWFVCVYVWGTSEYFWSCFTHGLNTLLRIDVYKSVLVPVDRPSVSVYVRILCGCFQNIQSSERASFRSSRSYHVLSMSSGLLQNITPSCPYAQTSRSYSLIWFYTWVRRTRSLFFYLIGSLNPNLFSWFFMIEYDISMFLLFTYIIWMFYVLLWIITKLLTFSRLLYGLDHLTPAQTVKTLKFSCWHSP